MKKSKLLILISLLLLGCNTGSLSSDNPSESLSNTSSSEEILSNEEDSSINSSTYSIDYSELKEIKCSFSSLSFIFKAFLYFDKPTSIINFLTIFPKNVENSLIGVSKV